MAAALVAWAAAAVARAEDTRTSVVATISRDGSGLIVSYAFAEERTGLAFDPDEPLSPEADVSAVSRGARVSGAGVIWQTPARELVLRLAPDRAARVGHYPALVALEEGAFLVYVPALAPDPARHRTRWRFDAGPHGQVLAPRPSEGFAYLGAAGSVVRYGALAIVGGHDEPARRAQVQARAVQILSFYQQRLGSLRRRPVLVLPSVNVQPEALAGEATPNGVVVLPRWRDDTPDFDHLLAHELFHLWNGAGFSAREHYNDYWLLEGSAEYGAAVAVRSLWPERDRLEARLNQYLAPCRVSLGGSPLGALRDQRANSTAYSCGMIAHWALDAGLKRASAGRTDVFAIWRPLFRRAWDGGRFDELIAAHREAARALVTLRDAEGEDAWARFATALSSTGAAIERSAPGEAAFLEASVLTVLRAACGDNFSGYEQGAGLLRLDVDLPCPIPSGAELVAVGGEALRGDWSAVHAYLRRSCTSREPIAFTVRSGGREQALTAECDTIAEPREEWRVKHLF